MMKRPFFLLMIAAALLLTACVAPTTIPPAAPTTLAEPADRADAKSPPTGGSVTSLPAQATASMPISIYILDDDETGEYASARTVAEVETILVDAAEIWSQAGIELDIQTVQRLTVPASVLQEIAGGDFSGFFRTAGVHFNVPDLSLINGFYVSAIGGPNGIAPSGTRTFFVMDEPSVHDERVTAHEIGHILGLHHTQEDRERLLYPGTNGMSLTDEEGVVARYVAQGLLRGMR